MKKKLIVSAILTIALCFSLITGATYALFTTESLVTDAPEPKGCGCNHEGGMPGGMEGMY